MTCLVRMWDDWKSFCYKTGTTMTYILFANTNLNRFGMLTVGTEQFISYIILIVFVDLHWKVIVSVATNSSVNFFCIKEWFILLKVSNFSWIVQRSGCAKFAHSSCKVWLFGGISYSFLPYSERQDKNNFFFWNIILCVSWLHVNPKLYKLWVTTDRQKFSTAKKPLQLQTLKERSK